MSKKVAVVLSGCGFMDGSEIHEAVFTLLALDHAGAEVHCCSLEKLQSDVINHRTGKPSNESRNVLTESARIARGKITDIREINAADFDAVILPGGFGAAKNLCNYASAGANMKVDPDVARLLVEFHNAGKPIGSLCISPVVLASVFSELHPAVELTIGNDADTAANLEAIGATAIECSVREIHVDRKNRIVTSPAYMYGDKGPADIYAGIEKAVNAVLELA